MQIFRSACSKLGELTNFVIKFKRIKEQQTGIFT